MNNKWMRPITVALLFVAALIVFGFWANKENPTFTTGMSEATLPVVQFVYEDTLINEMHGYVKPMDTSTLRGHITPVGKNNDLKLQITSPDLRITNVAYEIRAVEDGALLIEDQHAVALSIGDITTCDVNLSGVLDNNKEYDMKITLKTESKDVYYYTRLVTSKDCHIEETLAFAKEFHSYTFREDAQEFIPTYMDPATGDATTLHYVDLTCTLRQVTWADFEGTRVSEIKASIEEITPYYNVIVLEYVLTATTEGNETEYYKVQEYYRLRWTEDRMYVLNFERTMNQFFQMENTFLRGEDQIVLGIRNNEVEYVTDEAENLIAFVQNGELWLYDRLEKQITQVFSFRELEGMEDREIWDQHDIHIIRVDENGNVDFVVLGYMNRGEHEGQVGLGSYHYDRDNNTVEEDIFIESNQPYDVFRCELQDFFYINEQRVLYLIQNEIFYQIDTISGTVTPLSKNMTKDNYAVSESNRYIARIDLEEGEYSTSIHLQDLKTGIVYEIEDEETRYLRPLGFMGEDFIYGVAKEAQVGLDENGRDIFAMSYLRIVDTADSAKKIIKTYKPIGAYIKSIGVDEQNIYVNLATIEDGHLIDNGQDIIMNRESEHAGQVKPATIVTEAKQREMVLTMKANAMDEPVEHVVSMHLHAEATTGDLSLQERPEEMYYAYAKGECIYASTQLWEAILAANEQQGVVIDQDKNILWHRAKSSTKTSIKNLTYNEEDASYHSLAKALSAILKKEGFAVSAGKALAEGKTPQEILSQYLSAAKVTNLYGCRTDELLYYVYLGTPVLAHVEDDNVILITGYNAKQITYYDPATNTDNSMSIEDADLRFARGGNQYLIYLK
ncbi:MAG: hypothetical protein J6R94_00390 [Agathobacter sp.]|nr:hypothetical protein [Agathobacter sp.]